MSQIGSSTFENKKTRLVIDMRGAEGGREGRGMYAYTRFHISFTLYVPMGKREVDNVYNHRVCLNNDRSDA